MDVNIKLIFLLIPLVVVSGCIGYPISEQVHRVEYTGSLNGSKSNLDETVLETGIASGTQWVFSAEGPRRQIGDIIYNYEYFLNINGKQTELSFLNIDNGEARWSYFLNINNRWIAFNLEQNHKSMTVVQFNSAGLISWDDIDVFHTGGITQMYIDKQGSSLVWKESGYGYFQYSMSNRKVITYKELEKIDNRLELVQIPVINSQYDDLDFYDVPGAYRTYNNYYMSARAVAQTKSIDKLYKYSDREEYLYRWAVAVNPITPHSLLEKLLNDESYYVANEARKRLNYYSR